MTAIVDPRSGIKRAWLVTENYANEMDANLLLLGQALTQLSVKDRNLTAPPGAEADGDTYIPAAAATGDWAGHEDDVAVYDATAAGWVFYAPRLGWVAYVEDEEVLIVFKSGGWSAGVAL